ncbi:MAG TPA: DUF4915 domain-containing protein [Chthoniobacteraceae bacterium]|jgi:hypothetical protein
MSASFHRSFLVTSIGAYADSGIGTGGFTCIDDGAAVVIDKIDSTALCEADGTIYRFARGLKSLIGYRPDGIRYTLALPEFRDIHDIVVQDGAFVCVSTGTNEVLWIDPLGRLLRRQKMEGDDDAWHLNCLWQRDGRLFASAFGRFAGHRDWLGKCTGTGMIFDVESGEDVFPGLCGPHNPRFIDGQWMVCNSHAQSLAIRQAGGEMRTVELAGFTRGFAFDAAYLYIGESANRKSEVPPECSSVAVIDRATYEVVHRFSVPFPEIYDIHLVSPELARTITSDLPRFQIDRPDERIRLLETQVELGLKELDTYKQWVEKLRRPKHLRQALTDVKRSLVRSITSR